MIYSSNNDLLDLASELEVLVLDDSFMGVSIDIEYEEGLDVEAQVIQIDNDEYEIQIRDGFVENLRTTVVHELVHVKQYIDGRLQDTPEGMYWDGLRIDTATVPYRELPWEVEARDLEGKY
jgi:hypothetical protein